MPSGAVKNMTRSNFGKLLYPGLSKIFFQSYTKAPSEYNKVLKIQSHDEYFMRQGRMMGLGPFRHKQESDFIQMDAGKYLSEKEIYFPTFALGYGVSFEMTEDDQYGQINKFSTELGNSATTTKELLSWDVFNTGDSATKRVGLDGKALFASDHVSGDAVTTMDNLSSEALSQTAIEGALTYFEKIVNERSEPCPMHGPKVLLIPPELKWKAKELLMSEYKPEYIVEPSSQYKDTGNSLNVLADEDVQYQVVHWFTKPDMWFMVDRNNHDILGVNRRAVTFDQTQDPKSTDSIFYATFRYVADFFDFRGAIGYMGA
jgi:phage major head subunit gpT-like protein